jgi:hypothetical protein
MKPNFAESDLQDLRGKAGYSNVGYPVVDIPGCAMSKKELEQMQAAFKRVRQENNTKEKALAFLVKAGLATSDGQLTEPYR